MNTVELFKLKTYYYQRLVELEKIRKQIIWDETYDKIMELKAIIKGVRFKYKYYDLLYRKEKLNEILERNESKTR